MCICIEYVQIKNYMNWIYYIVSDDGWKNTYIKDILIAVNPQDDLFSNWIKPKSTLRFLTLTENTTTQIHNPNTIYYWWRTRHGSIECHNLWQILMTKILAKYNRSWLRRNGRKIERMIDGRINQNVMSEIFFNNSPI